MGNRIENRVILGSLRYKTATDTDLLFNVPLTQNSKHNVEFDRTLDISLEDVFQGERQISGNFRPSCKFTILFKNSYTGKTDYSPYENNLFYIDSESAALQNCNTNSNVFWPGLPQYNEFDFIRTDYDVTGYTQPPNQHLTFIPKSASTYNWMFYMTYAYDNVFNKTMKAYEPISANYLNWVCGDGIPFIIFNTTSNGLGIVRFICPINHGLKENEFVKLSFSYNGNDLFKVDSFGDETFGSEDYIFNITNIGFTGNTFDNFKKGTLKRVILGENPTDSTSKYYVKKHKVLTKLDNAVLAKCGFEQNIFGISKKYESKQYTPNKVSRVSIKEGAQSYSLSFNEDVQINDLIDNQKRPISELYFTVIWRGYFGWTLGAKKQGWDFNLPLVLNQPSDWWDNTNINSNTSLPIDNYTTTWPHAFYYTRELTTGSTLDGDYCEWNDYEQKERVISNINHKITFNQTNFNLGNSTNSKLGYYYKPHNLIKIRDYSDYIEEGDADNIVGIPDYAYFSTDKNLFVWRDLYPYGYVDNNGIGVDYPFFNGTHYPFSNFVFRIIPEGTNYSERVINVPTIDFCE
jgi:hypothetical protein